MQLIYTYNNKLIFYSKQNVYPRDDRKLKKKKKKKKERKKRKHGHIHKLHIQMDHTNFFIKLL